MKEIQNSGGEAIANYNDALEGEKIVDTAMTAYGRVDILINNAGVFRDRPFTNLTFEEWKTVVEINLSSHYSITKAVWGIMKK